MGWWDNLKSGFSKQEGRSTPYVAGSRGKRAVVMPNRTFGPNRAVTADLKTTQNRSRDATRNSPYIGNAHRKLVSHEIGTGIKPKFKHENEAIRKAIADLWYDSEKELVAEEATPSFYAAQRLISRSRNESGEIFIRRRRRPASSGLNVNMQIQIIESEFLDPTYNEESLPNGNIIRSGIEFNRRGDRVAYHFYKSHPDERTDIFNNKLERIRVPARDVIHHYMPLRSGQLRGAPINLSAIFKNANLEQYDDFELERKKNHASFTGTIEREARYDDSGKLVDPFTGQPYDFDEDDMPSVKMAAGSIVQLGDGEKMNLYDAEKGGEFYADYMRQQLQAIAAAHGLPYELLTGDWGGLNDRLVRAVMDDFKREMKAIQELFFVAQVCKKVQEWWMDAAVLSGAISLPNYANLRKEYMACDWIPQGWAYVHPLQDLQAAKLAVEMGVSTVEQEARKRSGDAEANLKENIEYRAKKRDMEEENDLGEKNEADTDSGENIQ